MIEAINSNLDAHALNTQLRAKSGIFSSVPSVFKFFLAIAILATVATPAKSMDNIAQIRAKRPDWNQLSDNSVVSLVRDLYYPDASEEQLAKEIGVKLEVVPPRPKLGTIYRWRYQSCQKEAAQAPTPQGVVVGLRICREKFEQ